MTTPQTGVQDSGGGSPGSPRSADRPGATERAGEVARTAADTGREAARSVASTTSTEASRVTGEAKHQGRLLAGQVKDRVNEQVEQQRGHAIDVLRTTGGELKKAGGQGQSPLTEAIIGRTGRYANDLADYLDRRSLGEVVQDVRRFARQRPGVFLLGAAAAGVIVGRLTRGAVAAHQDSNGSSGSSSGHSSDVRSYEIPHGTQHQPYAEQPYPEQPYPEQPYPEQPYAQQPYADRPYPDELGREQR